MAHGEPIGRTNRVFNEFHQEIGVLRRQRSVNELVNPQGYVIGRVGPTGEVTDHHGLVSGYLSRNDNGAFSFHNHPRK